MFIAVNRSVIFLRSVRSKLSVPTLKSNKLRGAIRRGARQDWGCWCRESAAAEQSDLCLLVRGEAQRGGKVRYAAGHQTAIVAPGKIHVRREFLPVLELILHLRCLFEVLIVIDAKDTGWQVGIEEQAAAFRRKEARAGVPGGHERRQSLVIR